MVEDAREVLKRLLPLLHDQKEHGHPCLLMTPDFDPIFIMTDPLFLSQ